MKLSKTLHDVFYFILFLFFRKLLFANNAFLYQEIVLNDIENLPFPYYYYYFLNEYMLK